jgi:hypothetical protein
MPRRPKRRVKAWKSEQIPARVLLEMASSAKREAASEARASVLCAFSESNGEARAHRSETSTRGICDTTNYGGPAD